MKYNGKNLVLSPYLLALGILGFDALFTKLGGTEWMMDSKNIIIYFL